MPHSNEPASSSTIATPEPKLLRAENTRFHPLTTRSPSPSPHQTTPIAIVGCGYVADYYVPSIRLHPELTLIGVYDQSPSRRHALAQSASMPAYPSFEQLLDDPAVNLVVNLTNPDSHYEVSRRCLLAHKHVYSEKPLALRHQDALALATLARQRGLQLSCAPSSVLSPAAHNLANALRQNLIGTLRVIHAQMEDGPVPRMPYTTWLSTTGAPWPYRNEFKLGCVIEHGGYVVSWLAALCGPARRVSAFSTCLQPSKGQPGDPPFHGTDFATALLEFDHGVVARLSYGLHAPRDHSLTFVGDKGVLKLADISHDHSSLRFHRFLPIRRGLRLNPFGKRIPLPPSRGPRIPRQGAQRRDFAQGITDLAQAIRTSRPPRLSLDFALHVNEVVLAIENAKTASTHSLTTDFHPIPWEPPS